jgi:hypothetical protein
MFWGRLKTRLETLFPFGGRGRACVRGGSAIAGVSLISSIALAVPLLVFAGILTVGVVSALAAAGCEYRLGNVYLSADSGTGVGSCGVSEVGAKSAVLEPDIQTNGIETSYRLEYSDNPGGGPWLAVPGGSGVVSAGERGKLIQDELTGLDPETTYYIRISVANEYGSGEATLAQFTTEGLAPLAQHTTVLGTSETSAQLRGELKSHLETHWSLQYAAAESGPWATFAAGTAAASDKLQDTAVQQLTGLSPDTAYYVRELLTNEDGEDISQPVRLETAGPPAIESESASQVTASDATLEAQINSRDLEAGTDYQFQLATNTSEYRSEIVCPLETTPGPFLPCGVRTAGALPIGFVPGGSEGQSVSLDLAGAGIALEPDTTYHYRVVAARAIQTVDTISWEAPYVYGADQTFTTPPAADTGGGQGPGSGSGTNGGSGAAGVQETTASSVTGQGPVGQVLDDTVINKDSTISTKHLSVEPLTDAQRLAAALRVCKKKPKKQRAGCVARARRRYAIPGGHTYKQSDRKRSAHGDSGDTR